ncbi:uncharacterized protein LOC134647638 [Cydia amplana]|uniref:uncharacterized protein LOC134647638 n=1 Tax=Cydia amplana TaxID=1869771 RepID=UPI002FE50A68
MVNLPRPVEQVARPVGERGSDRHQGTRSHHQWGARYGRRREQMRQRPEPATLLELEHLAAKTVALMEKYAPKSENNFPMAMQLLRLQHNLHFMMVCENCHGTHNYDELLAPER